MSKANGTINTIGKIITYILVVLLVLGIAGGISYFVLRNQGITYYVNTTVKNILQIRTAEVYIFRPRINRNPLP